MEGEGKKDGNDILAGRLFSGRSPLSFATVTPLSFSRSPNVNHTAKVSSRYKRRSLTRMRCFGRDWEQPKNNFGSFDSPMGADNDAHYAECHSDPGEVGIVDKVADPKIVSRLGDYESACSIYHSNPLDEIENSASGCKSISS